jgi:soluble lytic murein transglycosylase-like protein
MRLIVMAGWVSCLAFPGAALAQGLDLNSPAQSRDEVFQRQANLIDGRLSQQYSRSDRLRPPSSRDDTTIPAFTGSYAGPYLDMARAAARRHSIPEDLYLRLIQQESGWNPHAVSEKGARGLAQLMPDTARMLAVDIDEPAENLEAGARYLAMMFERFGEWRLALAAYNAGPEKVVRHGGIPPYAETTHYVATILGG